MSTALSIRAARRDLVLQARERHPGADVATLQPFARWDERILAQALNDAGQVVANLKQSPMGDSANAESPATESQARDDAQQAKAGRGA